MFCFEGESEKSRNLSGQQGEESMVWDKMSCINGCMVKSNLVISLVPYSFRRAPAMHAVKKEATEPPINARNITEDTSDFLSGQSEPIRQVQLVCHKNKWHDLWHKLITCLFLFFEGRPGQGNTFIGPTYFFGQ